jgi:AcrR family transcriptional regulator
MHKKIMDRRIRRTREGLVSAFVDLLLQAGYENFTLAEVAARANVGRSTLYSHYTGKEDLLKECIGRLSALLASVIGPEVKVSTITPIIDHFIQQRSLNGVFFVVPVKSIWVRSLAGLIEPKIALLARESKARPLLGHKLIAPLLAEMQIALIANCLTAHPIPKPEAIAEAVIASSRAMIAALLGSHAGQY